MLNKILGKIDEILMPKTFWGRVLLIVAIPLIAISIVVFVVSYLIFLTFLFLAGIIFDPFYWLITGKRAPCFKLLEKLTQETHEYSI